MMSPPKISRGIPVMGDRLMGPGMMMSDEEDNLMSGMMNRMNRMMPDVNNIFDQMRTHMNDMMQRMLSQADDLEKGEHPEGSGKLVVIQSGPGYHREKTYNFGPDGVNVETKSGGDSNDSNNYGGLLKNSDMSKLYDTLLSCVQLQIRSFYACFFQCLTETPWRSSSSRRRT